MKLALPVWSIVLTALGVACGPIEATDPGAPVGDEIVNGREATDRAEMCVIEMQSRGASCSGALVAPDVVLTAAHCVAHETAWRVTCPYGVDRVAVRARRGVFADNYPARDDPNATGADLTLGSDVGLIKLDRALRGAAPARVSFRSLAGGDRVEAFGRIARDRLTNRVFRSPTFAITAVDRRNGYVVGTSTSVLESGDSGGPLADPTTHEIFAVAATVSPAGCPDGGTRACNFWSTLAGAETWYRSAFFELTGRAPDVGASGGDAGSTGRDAGRDAGG